MTDPQRSRGQAADADTSGAMGSRKATGAVKASVCATRLATSDNTTESGTSRPTQIAVSNSARLL